MPDDHNPLGSTEIYPQAIATIAYNATRQSYGVVGLASKNLVGGLAQMIVNDPTFGVEVSYDGQQHYLFKRQRARLRGKKASQGKP